MTLRPEFVEVLKDAVIQAELTEAERDQCLMLVDRITPEHDYRAAVYTAIERYLVHSGWNITKFGTPSAHFYMTPPRPPDGYTLGISDGPYQIVQALVTQLRADESGGLFIDPIEVPASVMAVLRDAARVAVASRISLWQALTDRGQMSELAMLTAIDERIMAMNSADSLTARVMIAAASWRAEEDTP